MTHAVARRRRRTLSLLLPAATLAALPLLSPSPAPASTWANPAGGSWTDAANWSPAVAPGYYPGHSDTGSPAYFNLGADAPDLSAYPGYSVALPDQLSTWLRVETDKVTFTQSPGTESTLSTLLVGYSPTETGALTLAGGTFSSYHVEVGHSGHGSLTVSPNTTLNAGSSAYAAGTTTGNASLAVTGPNSFLQAGDLNLANGAGSASLDLSAGAVALSRAGFGYPEYRFLTGTATLADRAGSTARLTASDPGTTFAYGTWTLGTNGGTASASFSNGAHAYVSTLTLGSRTGTASLSLDGPGTSLSSNSNRDLTVGDGAVSVGPNPTGRGTGTLSLSNAASLSAPIADLLIGSQGGQGTLTLASGSSVVSDSIYVGFIASAIGTLTITSGASLNNSRAYVGNFSATPANAPYAGTGTVTLGSDTPTPSTWTVTSTLYISQGSITLNPGGLLSSNSLYIFPFGTLSLHGGSASFATPVTVTGSLTGAGSLHAPSVAATGTYSTIAPDGTLSLDADLSLSPDSLLSFDLASPTSYDRLTSLHTLSFGGTLSLTLDPSFTPSPGDSFDLLDFSSATPGTTFSSLSLPPLPPGLTWDTSALYTTGTLAVTVPEPTSLLTVSALTLLLPLTRHRRT